MKRIDRLEAIIFVLTLSLSTLVAPGAIAAERNTSVPPLPATPGGAIAMFDRFSDAALKAALAQPGLRGRVETLLGLGGCDWSVSPDAARQTTARDAAAYLNSMEDADLSTVLNDSVLHDRIDAAFHREQCAARLNPVTPRAVNPDPYGYPAPYAAPYPYGYPYARYPGDTGYLDGDGRAPRAPVPAVPYPGAPYGGYNPGYPSW